MAARRRRANHCDRTAGKRLASLGAAREHAEDEQWIRHIARRVDEAVVVAISLSATNGLLKELALSAARAPERTVLIFPPVPAPELAARWSAAARVLPVPLAASSPLDPTITLAAVVDHGQLVAFTADQRDEAAYRAAIELAVKSILAKRHAWVSWPPPQVGDTHGGGVAAPPASHS